MNSQQGIVEFKSWWATEGEWVEEPNQRRNGMSGVQKIVRNGEVLYVKRMTQHLFHSLRYPFGRPTIVREIKALNELNRAGVNVPEIVYGKALKIDGQWRALLVTKEMTDFCSIAEWYQQQQETPCNDATRREMLRQVAIAFYHMHSVRRQHGCCYVRHIFVKTSGKIEAGFLDLEKSRRRWIRSKAANHDFHQLEKYLSPIPVEDWNQVKAFYYAL